MTKNNETATKLDDGNEVKIGDLREGTGGMRVRVRVNAIDADGKKAECTLVRSGTKKTLTIDTLTKAYKLVERNSGASS